MLPKAAQQFTDTCVTQLGDSVVAIFLVGSFARGDERANSDIDLFVVAKDVDRAWTQAMDEKRAAGDRVFKSDYVAPSLLAAIMAISEAVETSNRLDLDVVSVAKLHPFDYLRVKHDGISLHGVLPEIDTAGLTELDLAKDNIHDVYATARDYLPECGGAGAVAADKEWICRDIMKALNESLRFLRVARTGTYVRSVRELAYDFPILTLDPKENGKQLVREYVALCEEVAAIQQSAPGNA